MAVDLSGGGSVTPSTSSNASNAAAEAAQRAAAEAARRAAEEAARKRLEAAAAERLRDRLEIATARTPYAVAQDVFLGTPPSGPPVDPPPPGNQTVTVDPRQGAQGIVDGWEVTGGQQLGLRDPMVYQAYMARHETTLLGVANGITGGPPGPEALDATPAAASALVGPAIDVLAEQNPGASFRVLGRETSPVDSTYAGFQPPTVVIEMTAHGGTPEYYALAVPQGSNLGNLQAALADDPAAVAAWYGASQERLQAAGCPFEDPARALNWATAMGQQGMLDPGVVAQGIQQLSAEQQSAIHHDLAGQYLIPLRMEPPAPDDIIASADVFPGGSTSATAPTTFNYENIEGLADSTALPLPPGMDASSWRTALSAAQQAAPTTMTGLEAALRAGGMTQAQIDALRDSEPGAMPAVYALAAAGPDVTFERNLQFTLGPDNSSVTYEPAIIDGVERTVAVVDTSADRLLAGTGRTNELGPTYAVSDVPMTIRIPLPPGTTVDPSNPDAMYTVLNDQLQSLPTADVFLHGYQSTREVWTPDMQTWMNQSEGDTIGIAFSGMGSEGNALGSGLNPFTPRQYAFQTMETLDALGLYGKDLNVIGHSMGGAAGMEMGLAIDALHPVDPPDVRYVLIAPAVGPDSVPFLTEGLTSGLIDLQNDFGSTWPLDPRRWLAHLGNVALGGTVVNALLPGAPDYIQGVHSGYAGNYGFEQLAATSKGLLVQGYPDPSRVASFLAQNRVLVVAAAQDRLVDPQVVERVFGDDVITVPGNHYPHLGNSVDPAAAGSPAVILEAAKQLLNAPFLPHFRPGGGGGGGRLNVR